MDIEDIAVTMMITTPLEHINLNKAFLMNSDLKWILKDKVKDKIGDSNVIGLEFLSMHKKFHQSTTNNKEVIAEKWFCILDLVLTLPFDLFQPKSNQ